MVEAGIFDRTVLPDSSDTSTEKSDSFNDIVPFERFKYLFLRIMSYLLPASEHFICTDEVIKSPASALAIAASLRMKSFSVSKSV